jgi:hypothetical protein
MPTPAKKSAPAAPEADAPKFKVPKTEAEVADRWFSLMQQRLELNRQATKIEAEEKFLKAHIIDTLPRSRATGISGKLVTVKIEDKTRVDVTDWDAFYAHIVKNRNKGAFALLNRAVNAKSVQEYWDQGKQVPGLEPVGYKTLSYSAIKGAAK